MLKTRRSMVSGRSDDHKNVSPLGRSNSRMKELLAEEDLADVNADKKITNAQKKGKVNHLGFDTFVVKTNRYEYPRIGKVPATYYHSKIVDMNVREKNGKAILDVHYDLEDSYGRVYHIVQSYPAESQPYHRFADALVAAGVPENAKVNAGIGVEEIIEIDYISKSSDLGSIVNRKPYTPTEPADDDIDLDDEDDDFLPVDEE